MNGTVTCSHDTASEMKIVFVEREDPTIDTSGGIISYLNELSQYLIKRNITTYLLGVDVNRRSSEKKTGCFFSKCIPVVRRRHVNNVMYLISLFVKIKFFEITDTTIIHAQRPDMLVPFILFCRKNPKVCTLHGTHDISVYHKKGILYGKLYEFLQWISFKKTSVLIAVDCRTKDYYVKKYPWIKNKIVVIPPGVNLRKFMPMERSALRRKWNFSQTEKIILYVGRLEREKNLEFLIRVFKRMNERVKNIRLLLVGEGRDENNLMSLVTQLHLTNVTFHRTLSHDTIPEIINCANVFAFCSLYEGSPIVIKEVLLCGIPIVSVDVGDVKEIVKDIDGCYIAPRNEEDFTKKLMQAIKYEKRIRASDTCAVFDYRKTGRHTMRVYNSLLEKNVT
jgi:glycosyltransferase involved in cell wall biosynthesis